jgi:putative glutamine amidotransferase
LPKRIIMSARLPIVGLPCDHRNLEGHPFDMAGEKYILAVRDGAGATPFLIPSLDPPIPAREVLASVDGLLFTGSPSNVSPSYYGGPTPRDGNIADENRDATTLPLIKAALEEGVPSFFICRGLQELNVALGGTLFQHVAEAPGRMNHSAAHLKTIAEKYGPAHRVHVEEGGLFARLSAAREFSVNSLHGQAIDRLAPGLRVEATAPDGTIEAVSMPHAKGFVLAVQWHPEWRWWENAESRVIFAAFGEAVRNHAKARAKQEAVS